MDALFQVRQRRNLHKEQSLFLSEFLGGLCGDLPFVHEVDFVPDKYAHEVGVSIFANIRQPILDAVEGLPLCDVVDQNSPCCALVVGVSNGPIPRLADYVLFLSSRVPELSLHRQILDPYGFWGEIDSDRWPRISVVGVFDVAMQQIGLANPRVAY